jgi:hypothetical protein
MIKTKDIKGVIPSHPLGKAEIDREGLLKLLTEIMNAQHQRAMNGRIRNEKSFKLRLDAVRVFGYLASVYAGILKDSDLSDILQRLEALETNANSKN